MIPEPGKCSMGKIYNTGKIFFKNFAPMTWTGVTLLEDFDIWVDKHKLNDNHLQCMRDGYEGRPFIDHSKPKDMTPAGLMPFGVHKGKTFESIPTAYFVWLNKQDWIEKWPAIEAYGKYRISEENKDSLPVDVCKEMIGSLLEEINK